MSISKDLEKAAQEIKELQQLIASQYANATRSVNYKRIVSSRIQNSYSKDKKVYIQIRLETYQMLEGKEVKSTIEYNYTKQFGYSDIKQAIAYIKELKQITKEYINRSKYKQLDL
jgi:hypothetical protein